MKANVMPKTRKTKVAVEDTMPEDTSETQQWVATREYDLIENPYAELTREAARTLSLTTMKAVRAREADMAQLHRVIAAYSAVGMDSNGVVHALADE
jgi:hypothetical protein